MKINLNYERRQLKILNDQLRHTTNNKEIIKINNQIKYIMNYIKINS